MKFSLLFLMAYVLGVLTISGFLLHNWQMALTLVLGAYCALLIRIPTPRRLQRVLAMVFAGTLTFFIVRALLH